MKIKYYDASGKLTGYTEEPDGWFTSLLMAASWISILFIVVPTAILAVIMVIMPIIIAITAAVAP
jgi:hypothetical protein